MYVTGVLEKNVAALLKGKILLECIVPSTSGPVTWLRPGDSMPISSNYQVTDSLKDKIQVLGDPRKHQYHLFIHPVTYDDHGDWTCSDFSGWRQISKLQVLVAPPSFMPAVTPRNFTVKELNEDMWTFTCSAHYAFPPVSLTWVRETGLPFPYDVTPPSMVESDDHTKASSIRLIVSSTMHAGSRFSCQARHPAYRGQVYSQSLELRIPDKLKTRVKG